MPPYYEYKCLKNHIVEVTQKITEDALKICPKSNCKSSCKRLISEGVSSVWKGGAPTPKTYV